MKVLLKYIDDKGKALPKGMCDVFVELPNRKPQFVFRKGPEHAIRRRSKWSFIYEDKLYDFKRNVIKPWPLEKTT